MTGVSVLLPVYNGSRYLEGAARGILNQTWRDLELLVLDDGSTDDSSRIANGLNDPRVRVLRSESNRGLAATLNRGLEAATADIVARQDADDLSHPTRLERQVKFLNTHPDVGLVGTQAWVVDETGRCLKAVDLALEHESLVWQMLFDNPFVHTSVAFRKGLVTSPHRGYDESLPYNQDFELWIRLARLSRVANLRERLVLRRDHGASMTQLMKVASARDNRRILADNLPAVLGPVPADTVELVARAREGMGVDDLRRFAPLLDGWAKAYEASIKPPREDFRRTLARQYVRLAFLRQGRTPARIAMALWAGRRQGVGLAAALVTLAAQRVRLRLGSDPIKGFEVRSPKPSMAEGGR